MKLRSGRALCLAALLVCMGAPMGRAADSAALLYPAGAATFQANCVVCHGAKGAGQPSLAPPLTTYPVRYATIAEGRRQLVITVLYGIFGAVVVEQKRYDFKMPDFAHFDDDTLAAVLNFVVFDLGHTPPGTAPLVAAEIAAERSRSLDGAAVRAHRAGVLTTLGL